MEATGLSPEKGDVIIDVAAVRVGPLGIEDRYQSLVSPGGVEVSPFIAALTGITPEMLLSAPSWEQVRGELAEFMGDDLPIYGHNVQFDMHFLEQKGLTLQAERFVDSCDFATLYFPGAPSHSLEVLSHYLRLPHGEKHRAMGDVLATYELLRVLVGARDAHPEAKRLEELLSHKGTSWSGGHFFALEIPSAQATPPEVTLPRSADLDRTGAGIRAVRLRPQVQRFVSFVLSQSVPTIALVSPSEMETVRDLVAGEADATYFDAPEQMISRPLQQALLARESWSPEETLFALRLASIAPERLPVHQSALSLTHREKQLLPRFAPEAPLVSDIFATKQHIFMTYHAWHAHKDAIPAERRMVVSDAIRLEMHLHQSGKSYASFDQMTARLRTIGSRAAEAGVSLQEDLASLEFVLRYMFTGLAKLLRSDQKELALTETPDFVLSFAETWAKGLERLADRVRGTVAETSVTPSILQAKTTVEQALQRLGDARYLSLVSRLPQGVMLVSERRDLEEERAWFAARTDLVLAVGYTNAYLRPFVAVERLEEIDPCTLAGVEVDVATSQRLAANFSALDAIAELGTDQAKLLVCPGSGSHLEKVFDALYAGLHGEHCTVLANGKTGGRGKVRYSFMEHERAVLVASAPDAKGMGVEAGALIVTSLPFPATMSPYWKEAYGESNFGTLSLPLLMQQLVDLAWAVGPAEGLTIYITDQRVFEKAYGQDVLALFSKEPRGT